jgi:stringent starvation protein B
MTTDALVMTSTSSRPYLLRAVHEWITDNGLTPQIVVDAQRDEVRVPAAHVREGKIVLNISPTAVRGLALGNERVEFSARFGGTPFDVAVPVHAVLAIMARENGTGMSFPESQSDRRPPPEPQKRPTLKVVK